MKLGTKLMGGIALTTVMAASAAQARDLTVISFGGAYQEAQRKAYFEPYIAEHGPLRDEAYNGELAKIKAMVETGDITWDVVQMEGPELENACDEGLIERIDWDRLGGKEQFIDSAPMGDCGVGTIVYSVILAYDTSKLGDDGPQSWADFWNVERWPGKRALRKSAKFTLETALMADGVAVDDLYDVLSTPEGVERAFAKLDEIKDHIQWWESGAQPPQWLAAGDVVMTSAYNGRISTAVSEGQDFATVWDGQIYNLDGWAIVSGTENMDAAYDFVNLTNQPERQAVLSNTIPYGTIHPAAGASVAPEVKSQLPTAPENLGNALHQSTDFWIDHIEELNERFNNWASQ
ncbi:putative spermidine/putrescine transport system substrate-binding protein [Aliiroseovarius crassostreae]|nr:ABC transporter substrate-binding protein [Aliiroseovarius crassostreae]SFU71150.1 putative spermidine/putrescine transport system substrate-binding protein [Aliiroseovarius crassostreae]